MSKTLYEEYIYIVFVRKKTYFAFILYGTLSGASLDLSYEKWEAQ
jgi:hypothetical protein